MADPSPSQSNQPSSGSSSSPKLPSTEEAALLENLIDVIAENLDEPEESDAPTQPLSKMPPPQDNSPQFSVVVTNQAAQRSPLAKPTPPPKNSPPAILPHQRSRSLIARSATDQSKVSNTTERLLHLQLRVLNTLLKLQVTNDRAEEGEPATVPPPPKSPQSWVDWIWAKFKIGIMVLAIALAGLGLHQWVTSGDRQVQQRLSNAFDADPELSVYRVRSRIEDGQVILSGRVPTGTLQSSALTIARQVAPDYAVRNEVVVVQLPPNDQAIQRQVDQLLAIANEGEAIRSRATVKNQSITLEGTVESDAIADRLVAQLKQISGVVSVRDQLQRQPRAIATRVYFYAQSAEVLPADVTNKIAPIAKQLNAHPSWTLEIVGHQHSNEKPGESAPANGPSLASQRAIAVRARLEDLGIDRRRLTAIASSEMPPGTSVDESPWTQQVVIFNLRPAEPSKAP